MVSIGDVANRIGLADANGSRAVLMTLSKSGKPRHAYLSDVWAVELSNDVNALYAASGLFKAGSVSEYEGRTAANLERVLWLPFDADLLDYLGATGEDRKRLMADLGAMPQPELDELIAALRADLEETFAALDVPIHRLDYTGYGLCAYVYLNDADQQRVDDARAAHKIVVKALNTRYGHRLVDEQVSDAGTRVTRFPESVNHKGAIPRCVTTLISYDGVRTYPLGQRRSAARPTPASIPRTGEGLPGADCDRIIAAVEPSFHQGERHALTLALAGMLAKSGVPEDQATAMIGHLWSAEGGWARQPSVETTYARMRAGGAVQGYLGLRDRLPGAALEIVDGILGRYARATRGSVTVGPLSGEVTRKARTKSAAAFAPTPVPDAAVIGWFRAYVDLVEPTTEAPESFHLAAALSMIGACIGKRIGLYHASDRLYANFYALLIGPSGRSRKDTAIRRALALPQLPPPPGRPLAASGVSFRVVRDVSSAEGLIAMLRKRSNLYLYTSEFSKLMNNATRESTRSIAPTLMEAFDTPPKLENNTKANIENSEQQEAVNPFVSVMATVQPEILSELIGNQQQYSGFLNRWLLVVGDGKGARPSPPNLDEAAGWLLMRRALDAIQSYGDGSVLTFSPAADTRWNRWYVENYPSGQASSQEDAMGIRLGTLVKKTALVHAVLAQSSAVEVAHLDAAIALVDWAWGHTRTLLPTWGESPDARIERLVLEALERRGPTNRRKLQQVIGHRMGPGMFGRVIKAMIENGEVVETPERVIARCEPDEGEG